MKAKVAYQCKAQRTERPNRPDFVSEILKAIRAKPMTQTELANEVGCHTAAAAFWLHGFERNGIVEKFLGHRSGSGGKPPIMFKISDQWRNRG